MATAWTAQAAMPSRVRRSVEANPHDPCAITRIPIPSDSDSASVPTWPFFVERSRWRMSMTRASAYVAPRTRAVSSAQLAKSCIMDSWPAAHKRFQHRGHEEHKENLCAFGPRRQVQLLLGRELIHLEAHGF